MSRQVASDEDILDMITLRVRGVSTYDISAMRDFTASFIRTATNRVRDADIAYSGDHVAEAYW